MKRKAIIMTTALFLILGAAIVLGGQDAQAAKKKKVKATVKGSTLTISGKGAMPSSMKVKKSKRKKIKKIVVKKGVTSIPENAFTKYKNVTNAIVATSVKEIGRNAFKCRKLKKLTIPGDFENDSVYLISNKIKTVTFNTNLDIRNVASFDTNSLVVKKSDPKYKSVKGIIYSKDGKEIVRVPFQRGEVVLIDGCEVFCLQSVMYSNDDEYYGGVAGGCRVRKIVIPPSVKKVESDKYFVWSSAGLDGREVDGKIVGLQLIVKSRQLDASSLLELIQSLDMDIDVLMKQLPGQIFVKDDMYFTDTHVLLEYKGTDSEIKIPSGIKKIGDFVFSNYSRDHGISKLELPEGLVEIGWGSFYASFKGSVNAELVLPDSLKKIGKSAFEHNSIQKIKFGRSIKEIGDKAFSYVPLKTLTIPATVTKLGKEVFEFDEGSEIDVVVQGSSAGFSDEAFGSGCNLVYEKGPREQKVALFMPEKNYINTKKIRVNMAWTKVKGADGYEIVTATNAKFTKNKKLTTVKGSLRKKILTLKGKFKWTMDVYIKMRPYSYLNGKKIYGRWSKTVADIEMAEENEW